MKFLLDIIKGIFVGVANIIPGVSGGTMAVSMGVYDKIIGSLNRITKQFKKSFITLLPILIGMAVGIIGFTFIIPDCYKNFPFQTCMCFAGMIIGGIPELITATGKSLHKEKRSVNPLHIIFFIIFAGVAVWMAVTGTKEESSGVLSVNWLEMIKVFGVGLVAAAAMVIPGVSGSLIMMLLGYYYDIIGTVKLFISSFVAHDWGTMGSCALALVPFIIGCVLGILLVSKLISWLFKRFESVTYFSILGLVGASVFAIFYKMGSVSFTPITIVVGIALFLAATTLTYLLTAKSSPKTK